MNSDKTEFSSLKSKPLKLDDQFTYLDSNILSTESDDPISIDKTLTATDRLILIKSEFLQAIAMSVLLYGYTTWTLMRYIQEKLDENYSRITKQQLPLIPQNIQVK